VAAGGDDSFEEKTEDASEQRREEWKKEGRVVQSKELTASLLLLGLTMTLWGASRWTVSGFWNLFADTLGEAAKYGLGDWNTQTIMAIAKIIFQYFLYLIAPIGGAAMIIGALSSVAQTGFIWTSKPMEMDLNKLNPMNGLTRIFSLDVLVEMVKAILKLIGIGAVVYFFLKARILEAGILLDTEPNTVSAYLGKHIVGSLFSVALAMLVISGLDFAFQKFRHEKKMMMTKQEVKEERKQNEGNPQIKARIRGIQRRVATNKMLEAVKGADVVVTNPTHIAVALIYDRDNMFAPRVVAKGADFMAEKIKKIARDNGVPCVENVPLARAMFKALKIGQFISRDLFNAVAEVLAYVYRLKGKTSV
jgi:flagellar biosynthetic protein FlhB